MPPQLPIMVKQLWKSSGNYFYERDICKKICSKKCKVDQKTDTNTATNSRPIQPSRKRARATKEVKPKEPTESLKAPKVKDKSNYITPKYSIAARMAKPHPIPPRSISDCFESADLRRCAKAIEKYIVENHNLLENLQLKLAAKVPTRNSAHKERHGGTLVPDPSRTFPVKKADPPKFSAS